MQAAVLEGPGRFVLREMDKPVPGPGEILVRTYVCGMCTGEIDQWTGRLKDQDFPKFIGHEVSGVVEAVGDRVTSVGVGDRVALYAEGKGYAEYVVVPAAWAVRLPDHVSFEHALGEPIACAVNGVRKANPEIGDSVCLVGCGFMGLIMLQVFRARGAGLLIAVDRREPMLDLARELGATHVFNPDQTDVAEEVRALTSGAGADIGVEAAGVQSTLDLTAQLVRMEGKLEIFGFHLGGLRQVDLAHWNWMAFQIVNGHTRSPHMYVEGVRIGVGLLETGGLNMEPLVTHRYNLGDINRGFETAAAKPPGFVKGVIEF